jgi:hypothetical protein
MRADGMIVSRKSVLAEWSVVPRINERICACYAAGTVIAHAIGRECPDPFPVVFDDLGIPKTVPTIVFEDDVLAGCGGVGTGFLWALQTLETYVPSPNYLQLDPWRPPTPVRRLKLRGQGCEFCGDSIVMGAFASIWDL